MLKFFIVLLDISFSVKSQLFNFTVVGDFGLVEDLSYADKLFTAINEHTVNHPFSFFVTVGDNVYPKGIANKSNPGLKSYSMRKKILKISLFMLHLVIMIAMAALKLWLRLNIKI